MFSLILFILCYMGFIFFPSYKYLIAIAGAFSLVLSGSLGWQSAMSEIHWNVVGLFVGTLFLSELFMHSRVPAVIAEWLVNRTKTVGMALISILVLASVLSMFVENVAVVLIIAPIALALCEKLKISPVKPLMLLAMFSNMQGTSTLIGDPPSMILGAYMKMSFGDFFFYDDRLSIFFVVQTGVLCCLGLIVWMFRHKKESISLINIEEVKSWIPSLLLVLLIVILGFGSRFDKESVWLAGTTTMALALIGIVWQHFYAKWQSFGSLIRSLDWQTTFFLIGLFILVGAIRLDGWMDYLSSWIVNNVSGDLWVMYVFIILISLVISAFVDNVPYLIAMIPVVQHIAEAREFSLPLLTFALLVGSCLGGNITPIGASANIVAMSLLEKKGHRVAFSDFVSLGSVVTAFAVIPAAIFLWVIWS